ncbi:UDP-3-O-(3-hydroxymyristoyl)glucosamine N-acyltransferase [Acanthopleuribacter pedis]|uniref:UDP-3-O-acylglucosamine N-acyltransferase n=1 Tax=Acanthopleuribacter pedis TaxID=442870 RepID=A0A8J7QLI4_9BACT|nr:UDP-3-O-(3-hydroxymyristoyl)glucosamine N-acyltransferase [Acanthopleuribacter pedis]MBO1320498.1 UDP-3-O-(3-hydroxymyristoyl)glucosamine N-acyltransferase [Acanthopleuribacter pedis]
MKLSAIIAKYNLKAPEPLPRDFDVQSVRPLDRAGRNDLSFLNNKKYRGQAKTTAAGAVLTQTPVDGSHAIQLVCAEPYAVMARILADFHPEPEYPAGIHPRAVVEPGATVDPEASVGPLCHVAAGARIGKGSVLVSNVHVGRDTVVGDHCRLHPGVVLYHGVTLGDRVRIHAQSVIGGDGYGYAQTGGIHLKVPQIGGVVVGDDVEIGSNVSIDRGSLDDTRIGSGTKIDNLVQIAHGVDIGEHCLIVSQTGISGSSKLGKYTVLAGKVGVNGHVTLGDQVMVMGASVVTKDLKGPGKYAGNPAIPHMTYQRQKAHIRRFAELEKRVRQLESTLEEKEEFP